MKLLIEKHEIPKHLKQQYIQKCWYCSSVYIYTLEDCWFDWCSARYTDCPSCGKSNSVPLFKKKYKGENNE